MGKGQLREHGGSPAVAWQRWWAVVLGMCSGCGRGWNCTLVLPRLPPQKVTLGFHPRPASGLSLPLRVSSSAPCHLTGLFLLCSGSRSTEGREREVTWFFISHPKPPSPRRHSQVVGGQLSREKSPLAHGAEQQSRKGPCLQKGPFPPGPRAEACRPPKRLWFTP